MDVIDLEALQQTAVITDPYPHIIVERFIRPEAVAQVVRDFPNLPGAGSHPLKRLPSGNRLAALIGTLRGQAFARIMGDKFHVDLDGLPTLCTLRGETAATDGRIHTDSRSKVVTVLIYLNSDWTAAEGRLRILRSADDIEDCAAEVPPTQGTMLAFRRSDHSWHGHKPYVGPRKAIQFNWVTNDSARLGRTLHHGLSHVLKSLRTGTGRMAP